MTTDPGHRATATTATATTDPGHRAPATAATPTGPRLRATVHSEWVKFRSVRSVPAVLLAGAIVLLLGSWAVSAGYRSDWPNMSAADRAAFDPTFQSIRGIELAQLLLGALGVLTVTGEYASGLIRATFTATPQRAQVVAVKALVYGAVVWALSTVLSFAAFFLGQSLLTAPARHASLGDPGVLRAVLGGGGYLLLIGLLGLALGVLLRGTAAALAALFGVVLVLPIVAQLLPGEIGGRIGAWLPSSAGEQVWTVVPDAGTPLGPWQGAGVLALYVAVAAAAATYRLRRRDV